MLCSVGLTACSSPPEPPGNPVRLTLRNATERRVTGVLLRFDRPIRRVDNISATRDQLARITLRTSPADTLRAEGGSLQPGETVVFEILGKGGPPLPLDGRWIIDGAYGPNLRPEDMEVR
ncbi:MAG: hypothetical protein ACYTGN_14405 [Planctomycetota bacterium]